ncbi:MAG: hypothetical protein GX851_08380, partial [Clostridiales bacterium]|nr:hypothetical protein [Clostridiales bacterium]
MTCNEEILYLRELAKRYASFALSEENVAKKERCRKVNDLIPQRPPVWIDEIPWREMNTDDELTQHCEDSIHRSIEWFLLVNLYRMKHIPVDTVLPDYYPMWKHYSSTGIGVSIDEKVITVNKDSYISSHSFGDCLDTEEKLDLLCAPVITPHPDEDKACTAAAEQVFDGILPVRAVASHASSTPWDMLTRLRGVEPIYVDLYERPDFMHKCVSKLVEIELKRLEQLERYGLLSVEPPTLHCTPPYTNGLPSENYDPCSV